MVGNLISTWLKAHNLFGEDIHRTTSINNNSFRKNHKKFPIQNSHNRRPKQYTSLPSTFLPFSYLLDRMNSPSAGKLSSPGTSEMTPSLFSPVATTRHFARSTIWIIEHAKVPKSRTNHQQNHTACETQLKPETTMNG
ncbi:unnamed protein product [Dovyalis caffra]|uniref:Uncharacterized protein n=1 Tax=Dovyalis caffra TaxID=77055 RepID=A0AAV1R628_9ROSI|nr:unnamed protein product [Dovyalis caffra]